MKKCFLHILLVGVLGMLAVSCSDEYDSMGLDSRQAQVVFSVAMDTPVSRSRAAANDSIWGSDYAPSNAGDAYDNRIDINQFIVKIQDGEDGEKEYKIKDIIKWKADGAENVYKFVGVVEGIDQSTELTNPKVYVYANMGTTEPDDTFSQNAANIPMWGVKSVEGNLTFAPGTRVDLEEISLLRAMAKLEVSLNDEMFKEYALTGATLNKHNSEGYTLPMLPEAFDGSTEDLSLEGVLRPLKKDNSQGTLALDSVVTDSSYVVYLPEVKNEDLKITVKLKQKKVDAATGKVTYGSEEEGTFSLSSDIVRNHWYKYNITGFAASQIQVNYEVVDWTNVNIAIGGEGFLTLNRDVVEVYNANVDTDQLKFYSSSPIKSIVLKDLYTHDRDGNIVEGATDGVSAYYITKYGQKVQLGQDPGFTIADKEEALRRDSVILSNISATAEAGALNGGITITSPFMADQTNEIIELQQNSHYDTPRYLEFLVTNEQDLTATFRVIQYPPVVITNIEGYFSYREDYRIGDLDHTYDISQFTEPACLIKPVDNGEPTHYHNPITPFFSISCFWPYHVHEWDPEKKRMIMNPTQPTEAFGTCPDNRAYAKFEECVAGLMERDYIRVDEYKGGPVSGVFHRTHYLWDTGGAFVGGNIGKPSNYYQNVGPVYEKQYEVDDIDAETGEIIGKKTITKYYRRHYTGDAFQFYRSKHVELPINSDGTAAIASQRCQYDYTGPWTTWSVWYPKGNHRMYQIRTTITSEEYIIGKPNMVTIDGRTYTGEGEANSKMVSPNFMVASMLGETSVPADRNDGYVLPDEGGLYPLAQRQCEQYVEAHFEDLNGNGTWEEGEPVIHYDDWRLPTKAEVALIAKYQRNSRAMDNLLPGETYYCASIKEGEYSAATVLSDRIEGATKGGYYMRCVRDVKPEGQNGFLEGQKNKN